MVTLIRNVHLNPVHDPNQIGAVCILTEIGADPVQGLIVYNVPFSVRTQTFLHTVCFAPVTDACLLGLDFLQATASALDLGNNNLTIGPDIIPVNASVAAEHTFSKVIIVWRTVLQLGSASFWPCKKARSLDMQNLLSKCLLQSKPTFLRFLWLSRMVLMVVAFLHINSKCCQKYLRLNKN